MTWNVPVSFSEWHNQHNLLSALHASILLDWCRQGELRCAAGLDFGGDMSVREGIAERRHRIFQAGMGNIGCVSRPRADSRPLRRFDSPGLAGPGSLANIIARRRRPFELLLKHKQAVVRDAAEGLMAHINSAEDRQREWERAKDQERDQRFE